MDMSQLQGLLSFAPTPEEKQKAMTYGLIGAGLGILSSNAQNPRGAGFSGTLGGAMPGLQMYQQTLSNAPKERMQQAQGMMTLNKLQKDIKTQELLTGFYGGNSGGATSPEAALSQGASMGDVGPTNSNAARIGATPQSSGTPNFGALIAGGVPAETVKAMMEDWKLRNPEMSFHSGFGIDPRSGQIRTSLPQTNQQGFSTMTVPDANAPGGFRVQVTPGAAEAFGTQARVGEQARADFDLVSVPVPGGGTQLMPRSRAAAMLNGQSQQSPMPQPIPGAATPPGFPTIPPQVQAQRDAEAGRIIDRERTGAGIPTNQVVQGSTAGGLGFSRPESQAAGDRAMAEGRAKDAIDREVKLRNSWGEANNRYQQLDLMENLFQDPNVASGALAESISSLKGVADSLGIRTQGKPAEDVIQAVAGEMALKMRLQGGENLMPGQMSNFEQQLLRSMSPSLSQSREGRMLLVQVFKAKTERDMRISEMAADYVDKNGRLDSGFDRQVREYVRSNPMFEQSRANAMIELSKRLAGSR